MDAHRSREVRSAKALSFVQTEHSRTLEDLHQEIQRLQMKCSDLNFKLIMASAKSSETEDKSPSAREKELERQLVELSAEGAKWRSQATRKDEELSLAVHNFKEELCAIQEQLRQRDKTIHSLHAELDERADMVATLSNKLRTANMKKLQEAPEAEAVDAKSSPAESLAVNSCSDPTPRPPSTPRSLSASADWRNKRLQKCLSATAVLRPDAPAPQSQRSRLMGTSERSARDSNIEDRSGRGLTWNHSKNAHQTIEKTSSARPAKALKERSRTIHGLPSADLHLLQSLSTNEQLTVKPQPAVLPPIPTKTRDENPQRPQQGQDEAEGKGKSSARHRQVESGELSSARAVAVLPQPFLRAAFAGPRISRQKRPALLAAHRQSGRQGARSALEMDTNLSTSRDVRVEKIISKATGKTAATPPTRRQMTSDSAGAGQ